MIVQYQKGKLYKMKFYHWPVFTLHTSFGVSNDNGDSYRKTLTAGKIDEAIFLYLGNIPSVETTEGLHHVIYQDMVGAIDARMILELLEEDRNDEE